MLLMANPTILQFLADWQQQNWACRVTNPDETLLDLLAAGWYSEIARLCRYAAYYAPLSMQSSHNSMHNLVLLRLNLQHNIQIEVETNDACY